MEGIGEYKNYVVRKNAKLYKLNKMISELAVHFMKYNIDNTQLGARAFLLENEALYGLKANVLFKETSKEGLEDFLNERRGFYQDIFEDLESVGLNFKAKRAKSEIDATNSIAKALGIAIAKKEEIEMETQSNIFERLDNNIDALATRLEEERCVSSAALVSAIQKTMLAKEDVKMEVKKFVVAGQADKLENHLLAEENCSEGDKRTAVCFAERCVHDLQYEKTRE